MSDVCAVHGTNPAGWKSWHQVFAEPKVSQRASASAVRRGAVGKPKAKSRDDEQKPDMRRSTSGASGHVTTKPSICKWDVCCKSGVYARKDSCLTTGDLPCVVAAQAAKRLSAGKLVLSAWQKSAKGIVGATRTEGPNLER